MIEELGTGIEYVVDPGQIAAHELVILVNIGFQGLTQVQGLLEHVVGNHATAHVSIAYVGTHVQRLGLINDGTEQVAA